MNRNLQLVLLLAAAGIAGLFGMMLVRAFPGLWILSLLVLIAFIPYIIWNLLGTKSAVTMDATDRTAALAFATPADRAAVYFVRTGFMAKMVGMRVEVDGQVVAQLKSPRFTRIEVAPGAHHIKAGFSGGAGVQSRAAETSLACAAGDIHIIHFGIDVGAIKNKIAAEVWTLDEARAKLPGINSVVAEVPVV